MQKRASSIAHIIYGKRKWKKMTSHARKTYRRTEK